MQIRGQYGRFSPLWTLYPKCGYFVDLVLSSFESPNRGTDVRRLVVPWTGLAVPGQANLLGGVLIA
jgi:hypothetical protein